MKVSSNNFVNNDYNTKKSNTAFKAGLSSILSGSGSLMQTIENGGFLASFLIQDFGGMTIPRTAAGFLRDKEVTGEYNIQEGLEVLGREGLTGPCMMAVAPLVFLVAAKFGKSTSVNTQLIKKFGNSLTDMVKNPNLDKSILNDTAKFKEEFYKKNIANMLENSLGKGNYTNDSIEYILKEVKNYENIPKDVDLSKFRAKAKYKSQKLSNISEHFDKLRYSTSSDLNMLQKVKLSSGANDTAKAFNTTNAIEAMIKYSDDIVKYNNDLTKLDELTSESLKNKTLGKRIITNISTIAATLGILSVLPKIYAFGSTAPGARKNVEQTSTNKEVNNNPSFKGKNNSSWLEIFGKKINKIKSDFFSSELEYNGHNFTNTLMASLSLFGLLTPRGLRAYNRAQTDENGKKDLTELWEILVRDVSSSLAVVFLVPMGTRAAVTSYEKKSGFVLMQKDRNMSKLKTMLDLLNPYSKAHVMTNSELTSLYGNIDSKVKMLNFCDYINKNNGDLQKILTKSKNKDIIFNNAAIKLDELKGLSKAKSNEKIISHIKASKLSDEAIKKLMETTLGNKNKIATFAKGLNSIPGLLTTFLISPYVLGWFIPRLTYMNTRRIHEKEDREKEMAKFNA